MAFGKSLGDPRSCVSPLLGFYRDAAVFWTCLSKFFPPQSLLGGFLQELQGLWLCVLPVFLSFRRVPSAFHSDHQRSSSSFIIAAFYQQVFGSELWLKSLSLSLSMSLSLLLAGWFGWGFWASPRLPVAGPSSAGGPLLMHILLVPPSFLPPFPGLALPFLSLSLNVFLAFPKTFHLTVCSLDLQKFELHNSQCTSAQLDGWFGAQKVFP